VECGAVMNIRERLEKREHEILSPYAGYSDMSKGRINPEPQCDIRPVYQRDRDRIIHSKSFRRLKQKTQVFLAPVGDHYRTRLTHTLEVSQNARTIAKALRLNEDLTEAIALGHDLGHTPYGHCGERVLNELCPGGFSHNEQSVRVVDLLEKDGKGLNLTYEVRDGIINHKTSGKPCTLEGKIVRLSDKIAYINSDIDDSIRAQILKEEDIPKEYTDILGNNLNVRLNTLIHDIILESEGKNDILMSNEKYEALMGLRKFMFDNVYSNPVAKSEEKKAAHVVEQLFYYYCEHTDEMPDEFLNLISKGTSKERVVCDFIACMSDQFATNTFKQLAIPKTWNVM
jgi:putative dGTPase